MFGGDGNPPSLTTEGVSRWLSGLKAHPHAWIVEHDGGLLGEVRLDDLNEHDARARLAIGLFDPKRLGKGLGQETIGLVLRFDASLLETSSRAL
jgi:RimJ/RimL family protein N-acetyltransferase